MGYMALELDISKAYDRMEWNFLERAMLHLGFSGRFVATIMSCIKSASYSVLLNGVLGSTIKPSRGLRQGDPLSPYLFLVCAIGLQGLLHKAEADGSLRGVFICRNGPRVSHLFFADNSVLFCREKESECQVILDNLSVYERGLGQKINKDKTNIFFSANTQHDLQARIQQLLGVPAIRQYEKYLGLPAFVGRAKKQGFAYIKERIWRKIQGWKEKLLSQAGKEVLIKLVIQAIPTYSMSCFKLPKCLIKEIKIMIQKFWWGYSGDGKKVHWVKWERLCQGKDFGGLDFKEIKNFNEALLAKQVWRMLKNPDSLCHRVFKAQFFPDCSILEATNTANGSYAWKSILSAWNAVQKGVVWRIGDGKLVCIKEDKSLPNQSINR